MSIVIATADRNLGDLINDLVAQAQAVREDYLPELRAALTSDDSERIDSAVSRMTVDANYLLGFIGMLEGYEVTCEYTFASDVTIDDNFQVTVYVNRDRLVEPTSHA